MKEMKETLLVAVCLCAFNLLVVDSAAWSDEVKIERVYGRRVWYCEYKGIRILPRTVIRDYDDCSVCKCRRSGLKCFTTLPLMLSTPTPDSLCMPVTVGCKTIWVLRRRPFIKCPTDQTPDITLIGK